MKQIAASLRSAHQHTIVIFENYGHIFFFAQVAYDHVPHGDSYGSVAAAAAGAYALAAFIAHTRSEG